MSLFAPFPKELAPNAVARFGALAHQVPLADIIDSCYVLTDGTLVAAFRLAAFQADTADETTVGGWDRGLQAVLNAMQPGLQLKVMYRQHHNYRDTLAEFATQGAGGNAFARLVQEDEVSMWQRVMEAKQLLRSEVIAALSFKPPRGVFDPSMSPADALRALLPSADASGQRRTRARHRSAVEELERTMAACVQAMGIAGLRPERLDDNGLARLGYDMLNPNRALVLPGPVFTPDPVTPGPALVRPNAADVLFGRFAEGEGRTALQKHPGFRVLAPATVREQLVHADWRVTENFVETDGVYTGVVSMRLLPEQTQAGLMLQLLQLPFQMTVTVDAFMLKKQKEAAAAWKGARMAESASKATLLPTTTADPQLSAAAAEAKEQYLEMANASQNVFRTRVLVTVYADSVRALDERCTMVLQTMRLMNSMTGTRERFGVDSLIKASWPFGLVTDLNTRKTITKHASALLPTFGSWEGSRRPRALFRDPAGRLVKHDPFNIDLANKNKIVVGRSGAGKSFATQLVDILPMLAAGAELLCVDSGASFLATTKCAGGRFLLVGPQSEFVYNIFDLPRGFMAMPEKERDKVVAFKIATISDLLLCMAAIIDDRERGRIGAVLSDIVSQMYDRLLREVLDGRRMLEREQMPRLRDLHVLLGQYENVDDPSATALIRQVFTDIRRYVVWTSVDGTQVRGAYAGVLDVFTNFDVDQQMTTFEFGDVKNTKDLMNPLALVFISGLMYNRMMSRDGKERIVILDEAWALLEHPSARAAIMRFYREARKMGSAVTLITQAYADLDNEIGRPLLDNATTTYFLRHQKNAPNDAAMEKTGVNSRRREAIFDLVQVKGEYSQIMLKIDDDWAVVQLEPTPLKYHLASTDPPDLVKRAEYMAIYERGWNLTWAQVIVILAHDYPHGVAADRGGPKLSEYQALALAERFQLRLAEMESRIRAGTNGGLTA